MVCSKFWKLDKIDKIVIALTFIVVSMFSIFSCFCFASEEIVDGTSVNGFYINSNGFFVSSDNAQGLYFDISLNDRYIVINNKSFVTIRCAFLYDVPSVDSQPYEVVEVSPGTTHTIDVKTSQYKYLIITSNNNLENVLVYKSNIVGLDAVINTLVENVGISSLWSVFDISLPYILIVVVVAFGIYLITRMIKGLSKGKGRL